MNKFGMLCVVLALFLPGCGKKDSASNSKKKVTKKAKSKDQRFADRSDASDLNEEADHFFSEGEVAEFAFVDDESTAQDDIVMLAQADEQDLESLAISSIDDLVEEESVEVAEADDLVDLPAVDNKVFKTVQFDINKNGIRSDQKEVLEDDINLAKAAVAEGKEVVVQGHCCQLGPDSYNLVLSQRRAESIKKEMVKRGVDEDAIKTVGYGNEMPVAWSDNKNRTELVKELAPNRRAEILVN